MNDWFIDSLIDLHDEHNIDLPVDIMMDRSILSKSLIMTVQSLFLGGL